MAGRSARRHRESGFAYLMALFMVLAIVISSEVVVENALTAGRRDREADLIWRGDQYVRAIRLYYHKTGHYPQSLDDLKTGLPELHFLRTAAYKDPMNTEDGSWRFIYVTGSGQIVGSVRYANLQQMAFMELAGCPAVIYDGDSDSGEQSAGSGSSSFTAFSEMTTSTASSNSGASTSNVNGTSATSGTGSTSGMNNTSAQANPCTQPNLNGTPGQPGIGAQPATNALSGLAGAASLGATGGQSTLSGSSITSSSNTAGAGGFSPGQTPNPLTLLKPTGPVDEPVVGGFLTGIASKVDKKSVKVYKGGKKYKDWEFIWNPLEDQARAVQQGIGAAQQGGQSLLNGLGAGLAGAMNNGAAATGLNGAAPAGANGPGGSQSPPTQTPTQPSPDQGQPGQQPQQ